MTQPIAIVGMGAVFPGAADLSEYWRNLRDGVDAITDVPPARWDVAAHYAPVEECGPDAVYCRRGGFIDGLVDLDPSAYGIMPDALSVTEPDQLIALRTAAAALADIDGPVPADRSRIGVILGRGGYLTPGMVRLDQRVRTAAQLEQTMRELLPQLTERDIADVREAFTGALGGDGPDAALGLVPNFTASRIANRLDLRGPAYTVDAACASALLAVDQAVTLLSSRRCDLVLAGGVHHCHDICLWVVFSRLRALSTSQRCRPFHRDADGVLLGEGSGVLALKRLSDALRDRNRVYAVVRGVGVAGDGRTSSLVNPDSRGQARAIRLAWKEARLDSTQPGAIGLLEAHGTGTPVGDDVEIATLRDVFGNAQGQPHAVIGSVKSMIGHAMPAAGAAGLIKAALALYHHTLLPTLHCEEPHPGLAQTPFRPIAAARPWARPEDGSPRRAAVNAFGFGGINAHCVLEEPWRRRERGIAEVSVARANRSETVLRVSANSVREMIDALAVDDAELRDRARNFARSEPAGPVRLAVADPTTERLGLARKIAAGGESWRGGSGIWYTARPLLRYGGRLCFLFPGLEAEFAPRLAGVAARCDVSAPDLSRVRVGEVGEHGAAVVAVGLFWQQVMDALGVRADVMAGYSIGEWTAMTAAGVFDRAEVEAFMDGFDPAALRVPDLTYAAVGSSVTEVSRVLTKNSNVVISHDNAPRQVVVCGPRAEVADLLAGLRAQGVLGRTLPFGSGFHTPLLEPYIAPILQASRGFTVRAARTALWSATTAREIPEEPEAVRRLVVRQLLEPVRFRSLVRNLYDDGARVFLQLGTGQLPALVRDILGDAPHLAVPTDTSRRDGETQLQRVVSALWVAGAGPDLALLRADQPQPDTTGETSGGRSRSERVIESRERAVPVGLGAPGADFDPHTRRRLRALRPSRTGIGDSDLDALTALAARVPAVAELRATVTETARTVVSLYETALPDPRRDGSVGITARTVSVTVSLETMPYLRDHCFFAQRPDWPNLGDGWPVVPATTLIRLMMDLAVPKGLLAVRVTAARFARWIVAHPAIEVSVTVTPASGAVEVNVDRFAGATIHTADSWPAVPSPWPVPSADAEDRHPDVGADQMYLLRWLFHGPRFQVVSRIQAVGARHIRGQFTTLDVPGALLDGVGQLLGYWLIVTQTENTVVFPIGIGEIRFHGSDPVPGTPVDCHIRITRLTDRLLSADAQLLVDGQVWAEIDDWHDKRFDSPPGVVRVSRAPDRHTLAERQPGGWYLVHEWWPEPASRELTMLGQLGGREREEYAELRPVERGPWLLGRIAAKDAVRHHLWERGTGPIFPAELRIHDNGTERPDARGEYDRLLPSLGLSFAACAEVGIPYVSSASTPVEFSDALDGLPKVREWVWDRLAALRSRFGDPSAHHDPRFSPHLIILYSTPALTGKLASTPRTLRFVGPVLSPRCGPEFPWGRIDPARRLILVSLGTTNIADSTRFLHECASAVRARPEILQAVIADPSGTLPSKNDNVLIAPTIPQLPLLRCAAATICHAGHGTVTESLWYAVPLVVAPARDDQPVIAAQVMESGAGIRIRFGRADEKRIGAALDVVLDDPTYRGAATMVSESFRCAGGALKAADDVEALLPQSRPL